MLKEVEWSEYRDYKTGSENEPLQFYIDALCNSNTFDLLLGYFSSTAISVLSLGFANFIYSGGKMKLIINNVLSEKDKIAIDEGQNNDSSIYNISLDNIYKLRSTLDSYGTHFFQCLAYLIASKRITVKIIQPKFGHGISHYKSGIFSDENNVIGFKASCNFTAYGLLENLEELDCFLNWENGRSNKWINSQKQYFDTIFTEKADFVDYLKIEDVVSAIQEEFGGKTMDELLLNEKILIDKRKKIPNNQKLKKSFENALNKIEEIEEKELEPRFPYPEGPREYQKIAYNNWLENNRQGLFAMATGTGKTITSLNCILEDYKLTNYYKFLVLVPTVSLANQWEKEITKKFNFEDVFLCSSLNSKWIDELKSIGRSIKLGNDVNYCILTTYATFRGEKFQRLLNDLFSSELKKITLIADEAHTFGAPELLKVLPFSIEKRIGLSATPERQYDEIGENELSKFFNSSAPNYTYKYNMKKAIEDKVLCRYYYYPVIVELESEELNEYREISKKLLKFLDPKTGRYKDDPYVNNLLIKRKNIIHKANRKSKKLLEIIDVIGKENFHYAFIYVPEGYETKYFESDLDDDQNNSERIIDDYTEMLYENYGFKLKKFTGESKNREDILEQFGNGKLDALLAMKCLDEGVDIPQTKYAIFCSSTGNPRQYIQRRGRVLRYHGNKEYAYIYDMIVKPVLDVTNIDENQIRLEKNIFKSELNRVINFAVLSENKLNVLQELESIAYDLDIDIYEMANNEEEKYI